MAIGEWRNAKINCQAVQDNRGQPASLAQEARNKTAHEQRSRLNPIRL
jgi:hypothetical protein